MNTHFIHFHSVEPVQIPQECGSEAKAFFAFSKALVPVVFWDSAPNPKHLPVSSATHSAQSCMRCHNCNAL